MSPSPAGDDAFDLRVEVMFARLEAKLDVALAHQSAKVDVHDRQLADHEARLRAEEATPKVTPRAMWVGLGVVAAAVSAASPFLDRLYS